MRNKTGLTSINYFLNSEEENLPKILKHANYLREMDKKFQSHLPLALVGLCKIANIRPNLVVLICKSQLEASKVRMHSRMILQLFAKNFKIPVKKVKIIIDSSDIHL